MTATAAVAISTMASIQAQQARETACKSLISGFDSKTANLNEQREYAGCIRQVYGSGEPLTGGEAILVKIVIIILFIAFIYGFINPFDGYGNQTIFDRFMGALIAAVIAVVAIILICLALAGVIFLFQ